MNYYKIILILTCVVLFSSLIMASEEISNQPRVIRLNLEKMEGIFSLLKSHNVPISPETCFVFDNDETLSRMCAQIGDDYKITALFSAERRREFLSTFHRAFDKINDSPPMVFKKKQDYLTFFEIIQKLLGYFSSDEMLFYAPVENKIKYVIRKLNEEKALKFIASGLPYTAEKGKYFKLIDFKKTLQECQNLYLKTEASEKGLSIVNYIRENFKDSHIGNIIFIDNNDQACRKMESFMKKFVKKQMYEQDDPYPVDSSKLRVFILHYTRAKKLISSDLIVQEYHMALKVFEKDLSF